jgi:hypothetical protein
MRRVRLLLAMLAAIVFVGPAIAAEQVDLLLVLASDVSRSVDAAKFKLQRDGYVAAISNPRVIEAIKSGPHGRIAICFIEWSGVGAQKVVIDWMMIDGAKAAQDFAGQLDEAQRSFADRTSISGGIDFAMTQLEHAPFQATRRTIDVSGDGTNNSGRDVTAARDEALAQGVTINGGLDAYYRNNVTGGPNSFVMVAENFNTFGQAILNKLVAEVAAADRAEQTAAAQ